MSKKSYISADDILLRANSVSRPLEVPNAVVGYISDLIQKIAKEKVIKKKNKSSLIHIQVDEQLDLKYIAFFQDQF
jgi:hypothetical protein